jgi:hypothetical protein
MEWNGTEYDFDNKKDAIKAFYQAIFNTIPERHYEVRAQYGVPRKIYHI